MKKILLLSIFLCSVFYTFGQQKLKTIQKNDPSVPFFVEEYQVLKKQKDIKQGTYTLNGRKGVVLSGNYNNNKKSGIWKSYQSNGELYYTYDFDTESLIDFSPLKIFQYKEEEFDTPPILVRGEADFGVKVYSRVRYPSEAQKEGIQGRVMFALTVSEQGKISNVEIVRGGHESLKKEAMRALKSVMAIVEWIPATKDGEKIATEVMYEVRFKLAK